MCTSPLYTTTGSCPPLGDYSTRPRSCDDHNVVERVKGLRKPITAVINGHRVDLLTVGHLANAVGRSNWTVSYWTKVGLLPPAPVIERPDTLNLRRHLYPAEFVRAIRVIARSDYVHDRLDRTDWPRFHAEVHKAYQATIAPLLESVLSDEVRITVDDGE